MHYHASGIDSLLHSKIVPLILGAVGRCNMLESNRPGYRPGSIIIEKKW